MSGIAIVISGADFSAKNLGKVTFLQDVDVTGIVINGSDSVTGISSIYTVGYTPVTTSQKGVNWSVTSGSEYASIDSTGLLTIKEGANANSVTIEAVSTFNNTVIATKTVAVTYVNVVDVLTSISVSEDLTFSELNKRKMQVAFNPANTAYKGVTWSITSGGTYATVDANGYITVLNTATTAQNVTVKAVSTHDASINSSATISVTYQAGPSWDLSLRYGIMDSTTLVEAMRDNSTSMLVEFADDSANHTNGDAVTILYSLGEMVTDNQDTYKRNMPLLYNNNWNMKLSTGLLKNIPWTAGTTTNVTGGTFAGGRIVEPIGSTLGQATAGKALLIYDNGNSTYVDSTPLTVATTYNNGWGAHKYLSFGFQNLAKVALTDLPTYYNSINPTTGKRNVTKAFKIKTFIIVPGNFTTIADVKANRASAYFDLAFDGSGVPYNAGSKGTLITSLVSELTA